MNSKISGGKKMNFKIFGCSENQQGNLIVCVCVWYSSLSPAARPLPSCFKMFQASLETRWWLCVCVCVRGEYLFLINLV